MPLKSELIGSGFAPLQANLIGQDPASAALTATGTTQATALALTSNFSVFGTVGSNTGAILGPTGIYLIINNGSNALLLYPPIGGNINGGTVNASFSVTNGKAAIAISNGLTWFVNLSA
jgi:hypothetical protein